jgi:hypothetical protein
MEVCKACNIHGVLHACRLLIGWALLSLLISLQRCRCLLVLLIDCCCSKCSFVGNNASYSGVMAAVGSSRINLTTCTFANNAVVNNGAVMIIGDKAQVSE